MSTIHLARGAALGVVATITTDSWPMCTLVLLALVVAFTIGDEASR